MVAVHHQRLLAVGGGEEIFQVALVEQQGAGDAGFLVAGRVAYVDEQGVAALQFDDPVFRADTFRPGFSFPGYWSATSAVSGCTQLSFMPMACSSWGSRKASSSQAKLIDTPLAPARPVRPMRWT